MKSRNTILLAVLTLALALLACGIFSTSVTKEPTTPPAFTPTLPPATDMPTAGPPQMETPPPVTYTPMVEPGQMVTPPPAQPARAPYYEPGDPVALDEIHMLSLTEGWALSGPFVLATADGGQTWRQATPPASLPEGTWMAASGPSVLETSDGGQTWRPAADPDSLHPWEQVRVHAAFLDACTAWVVYSVGTSFGLDTRTWHTADGGQTWTASLAIDTQIRGDGTWARIFALDPENLWLMACAAWVGAGQHFDCQFFRSRDGGGSWNAMDVDVGVDFTGMGFSDASHGWLIWQTLSAYYYVPPEYAFTIDSGLTWESHTFPPPPEAPNLFDEQYIYCEPYQLNLLTSQSIRLLVGCFDYAYRAEAFVSYLYASDDGGGTWSALRLPDPVYAPEYTLIYFDAYQVLLLGREMYSSADGGQTWTRVKTVSWDAQFSFVDRQNGLAVARSGGEVALVRTGNGGATWEEIRPTIGE
jgi:photosystem II stability/assembly factor-like uncharacterized protein